ncbi:flavin-containing monooxygenase-like protein [Xylariales sp. PMI_506]|nr:flavin-containing monooxygenase-like protein [Xylariales sp. PMI_506]
MTERNKVAVIGGGPLGLIALKELRETGFDVTGFEARPYVGGLWKDSEDSTLSVINTTVFNTSRFRAPMSDFPFTRSAGLYPTALEVLRYLESYADHFDLLKHYHLGSRVEKIVRENESWTLHVKDIETQQVITHTFDRVCVATGSFHKPRWPKLRGIEKFGGRVLHSVDYHGSEPFSDQNVLIIGLHATAQDVTDDLSRSAKHVYLSHRGGLIMLPRFTSDGEPFDASTGLRFFMFQSWAGANIPSMFNWLMDKAVTSISDASYPSLPESWGMRPAPPLAVSTPLVAEQLFPHLQSGFAEPVPAVQEITGPGTVVLTNGQVLENIDAILYCTGYHLVIPESLLPKSGDSSTEVDFNPYPDGPGHPPRLFRNILPISRDQKVRDSLAFVGQSATIFPGFVQFELQAMAISQIWRGWSTLPSYKEMTDWHEMHLKRRLAMMKKHGIPTTPGEMNTFYPVLVPLDDLMPWLDRVAGTGIYENFGGKFFGLFNPQSWSLWWRDREMYDLCTKGVMSPAIFRVFNTGGRKALSWGEIRAMLKSENEEYDQGVKAKKAEMELNNKRDQASS